MKNVQFMQILQGVAIAALVYLAFPKFKYTNLNVEVRMERCRTKLEGLTVNFEFNNDAD